MAKLTRYTSFESLKSDAVSSSSNSLDSNKNRSELEAFLQVLKAKLAAKEKPKTARGKQPE